MNAATRGYMNAGLYILGSTIGFLNKFKKEVWTKAKQCFVKTIGCARKKVEHDLRHIHER